MSKVDKWIFKSNYEQTVVVRPTTITGVYNAQGMMIPGSHVTMSPIKMKFDNCHCIVDAEFAKNNQIVLEDLILLIKAVPKFNKNFWLISEPDKPASKEVQKEIDKAPKKPKVIKGIRK